MTFPDTIVGMYHRQAHRFRDRVASYHRDTTTKRWVAKTWRDGAADIRSLACGLIALGVEAGDRVGLISETRAEWSQCDMAIMCAGAITVGVYPTSTPKQCGYVLEHAGASVCIVEDAHQIAKLDAAPSLTTVIVIDPGDALLTGARTPLQDVIDSGAAYHDQHPEDYEARWRSVQPDDLAMLVYTSGTTGPPKGVMLTHRNVCRTIESVASVLPAREDDLGIVYLPLAHSLQRVAAYLGMHQGITGVYAERLDKIVEHMQEFKPTLQAGVPRIYEKIHARILGRVAEAPPLRRRIFHWALEVGREVARLERARAPVPLPLRLRHRVADRLVLSRIRSVFGGRVRYMVSGAAPIAVELLEFFHACGILILEGYGLTETTAPATVNRPDDFRFGTVGLDLPICETAIAPDGEILIRGDNVFSGYWKDEAATAEAFTEDGWFRSGDIGEKDRDGFLRITDRKKEIIVTAGGKNVAPANIENLVRRAPLISQCLVHGDKRKYLVALITLDPEELAHTAERLGLDHREPAALADNTRIVAEVQAAVDAANAELARYETIKYFRILPEELSVEDDLMTPTLKLKRANIQKRYAGLLDEMYAPAEG